MADTFENNAYIFWDNDPFPSNVSVGDAFEKAGATVLYREDYEMIVIGLDLDVAKQIARDWQADYKGPVEVCSPGLKSLKVVTALAPPTFSNP